MEFKYKLQDNGRATDLQYGSTQEGFLTIEANEMPDIDTLHAKDFKAAKALQLLREKRTQLLESSDWTGLADSALTSEVSAKWKLYRQRLRDLPSGLNTPAKVKAAKWPTKPV